MDNIWLYILCTFTIIFILFEFWKLIIRKPWRNYYKGLESPQDYCENNYDDIFSNLDSETSQDYYEGFEGETYPDLNSELPKDYYNGTHGDFFSDLDSETPQDYYEGFEGETYPDLNSELPQDSYYGTHGNFFSDIGSPPPQNFNNDTHNEIFPDLDSQSSKEDCEKNCDDFFSNLDSETPQDYYEGFEGETYPDLNSELPQDSYYGTHGNFFSDIGSPPPQNFNNDTHDEIFPDLDSESSNDYYKEIYDRSHRRSKSNRSTVFGKVIWVREASLLSVYAPVIVNLNQNFIVQGIIHDKKEQKKANQLSNRFDNCNSLVGTKELLDRIDIGQKIGFRIIVKEIEEFNDFQEIIWTGKLSSVEFIVKVPENYIYDKIWISLTVLQDQIPFGSFTFTVNVTKNYSKTYAVQEHQFKPYRNAFISYSSTDRSEVIKRIQGFEAVGINVFQDFKSLKAGEDWEGKLIKKIPESDLFLLFWSSNAQQSKWVEKEWKYALKSQKSNPAQAPDIIPILIEGPPPPPPPKQLKHLHFNDPNLYFIGKNQKE